MMNTNKVPVFDGHNDTVLRLVRSDEEHPYSFFAENATGHLDLPRAKKGGLVGGIFAIYTPPPPDSPERGPDWGLTITETGYDQILASALDPAYARAFTQQVIDLLRAMEQESQGAVKVVTNAAEIRDCIAKDVLAVVMHFEGAEAVAADLSNLEDFYRQGLRSLGLVWSRPNAFATGVPFRYPSTPDTGPGLTEAGRALVRECNRLGILVDLAHINEPGFWDVAETSSAPLVVSHADVHAIVPSTRNLTDAQIDAVGRTGGIIGLNFEPVQTRPDAKPEKDTPLSTIVRHVDYVVNRIGIDHVGFGSDFDGTSMPAPLGDAAGLQNLVAAVREAGYDEEAVEKIAYKNWLRVLGATWK